MQTRHSNLMQRKKNEVGMMRTGFQGLLVLPLHLNLATRTNNNIENYYHDYMIFVETNLGDIEFTLLINLGSSLFCSSI